MSDEHEAVVTEDAATVDSQEETVIAEGAVEAAAAAATPVTYEKCPHCGMNAKYQPTAVPEDIKTRFHRSLLGGPVFTMDYTMYGGSVKLQLRTRTEAENADVQRAVTELLTEAESALSQPTLMASTAAFQLVHSLTLMKAEKSEVFTATPLTQLQKTWSEDNKSVARDKYMTRFGDRPSTLITGLITKQLEFNELLGTLVRHANDPDFF